MADHLAEPVLDALGSTGLGEAVGPTAVVVASSTMSMLSSVMTSLPTLLSTGAGTGAVGLTVPLGSADTMLAIFVSGATSGPVAGTDHVSPTTNWYCC